MRQLRFTRRFTREIAALPRSLQRETNEVAQILRGDPTDSILSPKKLLNVRGNQHRVHIGEHRLIYSFTQKTVLLRTIGHRRTVYRFL